MFMRMVVLLCFSFCVSLKTSSCDHSDKCIRLCCGTEIDVCESFYSTNFTDLEINFGQPCEKMLLVDDFEWSLENGRILSKTESEAINLSKHCLHLTTDNNETLVHLMACELQSQGDIEKFHKSLVRVIGTSISLPLLIITLFVLWHLKQFETNHGKCLMCHILSLILLYTFLILDRMDILIMKIAWLCKFSGYMMYLSILFCIFWLNVMCFDIWKTFRKVKNPNFRSEKFLKYFCYGYVLPLIITAMLYIIDETTFFPEKFRPQIGRFECFLKNDREIEFFYLYLPMSISLFVNVVLYSVTAFKIYSVQNNKLIVRGKVEKRRVSCNPIRMRFLLYLRLFLLMGLTWGMEAASWIFDANSTSFFIISDVANSIHGFVIFGLFVCRSKTLDSVLTKHRSSNKIGSTIILGKLQDNSQRNSRASDESLVKILKEKL